MFTDKVEGRLKTFVGISDEGSVGFMEAVLVVLLLVTYAIFVEIRR